MLYDEASFINTNLTVIFRVGFPLGASHFRGDCVESWNEVGFEAPAESSESLDEFPSLPGRALASTPARDYSYSNWAVAEQAWSARTRTQ